MRWNGRGKEYFLNNEIRFEGEYLNGKKWNGKLKEFYNNGEIKFEGKYVNGKEIKNK